MRRLLLIIPLLFACDSPVKPHEAIRPPQPVMVVQSDGFDLVAGGKAIYVHHIDADFLRKMADVLEDGGTVYIDGSRHRGVHESEFVVVIE